MINKGYKSKHFLLLFILIASLVLAQCSQPGLPPAPGPAPAPVKATATAAPEKPVATAPPAPTPTPTIQPLDLPPVAIAISPQRGQEQPLDAPISVTFDQPMDEASTSAAFAIEPLAPGQVAVKDANLVFTPSQPLERGQMYRVTVSQDAKSAGGKLLAAPVDLRFATVGFLEVTSTQPADGNEEVSVDTPITVVFNRPVVPLTGIDQQAGLAQPLTFDPPVTGQGQWLDTSIYTFIPDGPLAGGADYTATVAAGLQDATGGLLAEDYVFSFRTASPIVTAFYPEGERVAPTTPITVTFSQPMDQASSQAAFSLSDDTGNQALAGSFSWREGGRVMAFLPASPLAYDLRYSVRIDSAAQTAAGAATLREPFAARFKTAPKIAIVATAPPDGATGVAVEREFVVRFQGVIDERTLGKDAFTILPKPTAVYSYFNSYENRYIINWPIQPQTAYTVTLSGEIGDVFGNTLGQDTLVRFRTGNRKPFAHLNVPAEVGAYNAYTNTLVAVSYRNVSQLNFKLYAVSEADAQRLLGPQAWEVRQSYRPKAEALLREWSTPVTPEPNANTLAKLPLAEEGGPLPSGLYWLELRAPEVDYGDGSAESGQVAPRHLLIVSPLNLISKKSAEEILVWATDLSSGQPTPGVRIRVRGPATADGVTDSDGIMRAPIKQTEPWQPLVVFAGDLADAAGALASAPALYGAMSTDWQQGLGPWDFNLPGEFPPPLWQGYFYTDRPIYRPGQTVYWKGIIRADDDAIYQTPAPGTEMKIVIRNDRGEIIYEQVHQTNAFGAVYGDLPLAEEAGLGYYYIEASFAQIDPAASPQPTFGVGFQVAEYRKPEYLVELTTAQDEVLQGETIDAAVQANFFFGGPVSNAKVEWTAYSEDAPFTYTGDEWYSFSDYLGWDPNAMARFGGSVGSGQGVTDSQGRFSFQIPADIGDKANDQRFVIDVRITDLTNQEVADSASVVVHKGLVYPGLATRSYVSVVGQPNQVDLITVDWDSQPVPNQELAVGVSKAEWINVQKKAEDGQFYWTTEVKETPVLTETITTDAKGQAVFTWTPAEGGQYKINASVVDSQGNTVRSSTFVWASASPETYVSWRVDNNDRITLVADKAQYQVGDTAQVLVPHPYQGPVEALLTIERGRIIETQRLTLDGNSETLAIPISEDFTPDVFVSVVIVKGQDVQGAELGSFKLGYVKLPVDTTTKELQITLTPSQSELRPGQTVTFTMEVEDSAGQPVQAEFSLALIDKALLSLAQGDSMTLLDTFYRERGLGVQTASTLVVNLDRLNLQLQEGAKGGGGGGDGLGLVDVRSEFQDTAFWEPTVVTDATGRAVISVTLPDNLTTWRLDGRGVTIDTQVGQATVEIRTTLPLLVRPVLPRFFVSGDRAVIGAVVNNNTDVSRTVDVIMTAQGLTTTAALSQTLTVGAGEQARVTWPIVLLPPASDAPTAEAVVRFTAWETGAPSDIALGDAVQIALPVYRYSSPETVATAGAVALGAQRTEVIVLPPDVDPTQGELRVRLDPSLAAGTMESLGWLEHFPYECNEQIISKFLPNVVSYQALTQLPTAGLRPDDADEVRANLQEQITTAVQKLLQRQNADGGWGWWGGEDSRAFVSGYVVFGLVEAQQAGFSVDASAIERGAAYLEQQLKPVASLQGWQLNQQAFLLYVLAEAGQGDVGRSVALYDVRERLAHYGQAWLALTFGLLGEQGESTAQQRVAVLLDDLTGALVLSATGAHWEEQTTDWWTMNTNIRSTALALDALAKLDPQNALAPDVVRWLMAARQNAVWQTTQENAWAITALTDWMVASRELEGDYSYRVTLNAGELASGAVTPGTVDEPIELRVAVGNLLLDAANGLTISRFAEGSQSGEGQLYYTTYLNYYLPVADLQPLERGIVVDRQYALIDPATGKPKPGRASSDAQVGDTIQVTMTLIAPHDLYYLVLESPLPAGAEPIDPSLATTSQVYEGSQLERQGAPWWWWTPTETDLRDEKVVFFATELPAGTYQFTYQMRASLPGQFQTLPATAYEMYFPEVWGRSAGELFTIAGQ